MHDSAIRKHIPKEKYVGWTQVTPGGIFDDLTPAEKGDLSKGEEEFGRLHPGVRLFPDPFLARRAHPAPAAIGDLVVVPGEAGFFHHAAKRLVAGLEKVSEVRIKIMTADQLEEGLETGAPLVLLGHSVQNRISRQILTRFQLGIFDALFPGRGGWGVTCHGELAPGMAFRYLLAFDESTVEPAVEAFLNGALGGASGRLQWMHAVSPGGELIRQLGDFPAWLRKQIGPLHHHDAVAEWARTDFARPYREVFLDVLTCEYPDGVISNGRLIDLGVEALRYYQQVGDSRGLELFREMCAGFWDYLNSESPAIYPSDLDFRMGTFCDAWNWVEWHPGVTAGDLEQMPRLLLGAMRMVHGYFLDRWKYRHLERKKVEGRKGELDFRHNHQTFPALSLTQARRYFERWKLADPVVWQADADYIFEEIRPEGFKYSENANSYEVKVPEHYLAWLEATGRPVPDAFRDALARFAKRQWLMRDNAFRPVDYGDSTPGNLAPSRPLAVWPWLLSEREIHAEILELEKSAGGHFPAAIESAIHAFTGLVASDEKKTPPASGEWEVMPMDPLFAAEFGFEGTSDGWFDKICFRSGWGADSFYLAVEGVGSGHGISHSHHEVNGILRLNFAGRIWLVSNGYGKPIGVKTAGQAFSSRQTGPRDHNMLILQNAGSETPIPPPVNALLIEQGTDPVPYLVTELRHYGGCTWRRHIVGLDGEGVVVVDQLQAESGGGLPDQAWLEWNLPGTISPDPRGALIDQQGVTARFHHFETGHIAWEENGSSDWHQLLTGKRYPYAASPLRKAVVSPVLEGWRAQQELWFATGLWRGEAVEAASWDDGVKRLEVSLHPGPSALSATLELGALVVRLERKG